MDVYYIYEYVGLYRPIFYVKGALDDILFYFIVSFFPFGWISFIIEI